MMGEGGQDRRLDAKEQCEQTRGQTDKCKDKRINEKEQREQTNKQT
jgi:hypothetical protein